MKLYLDDNSANPLLVRLLQRAGHDVQVPSNVGLIGEDDPIHLAHAVRDKRATVSEDYVDFENLHDLIVAVGGHHPGILVIRQDNDPARDMRPPDIVRAIRNLENAGVPIPDEYIILNHWR